MSWKFVGDDAHEAVALGEAGEDPDGLLKALVGGAVIHHDKLEVLLRLGVDRFDGVLEPAFAVDVGDDDGRFHRFCAPAHFLLAYKRQYNIF